MKTVSASGAKPLSVLRDSLPSLITDDKNKLRFQECDSCWQRQVPVLCNGCLHNKQVIDRLNATVTSQWGHIVKYRKKLQQLLFAKGHKAD